MDRLTLGMCVEGRNLEEDDAYEVKALNEAHFCQALWPHLY